MKPVIQVRNIEAVKLFLHTVSNREARNIARNTIHAVAAQARDEIRAVAPVGTKNRKVSATKPWRSRRLRKSIKAKRNRPRGSYFSSKIVGLFYWRFLEFGTVKMTARPFVRPVRERFREEMPALFQKAFNEKVVARINRVRAKR